MTTIETILLVAGFVLVMAYPVFYLAGKGWATGNLDGRVQFVRENFRREKRDASARQA